MASASPLKVMILMVWPASFKKEYRAQYGDGDGDDDDQAASPVAEEKKDHQTGQDGAQYAFCHQTFGRIDHEDRLVELIADLYVVGQQAFSFPGSCSAGSAPPPRWMHRLF